jgi:isoleucyl-tRNA synthetase
VPPPAERPELDRWILSRLERATAVVTESLDDYEPLPAATAIAELVDETSNWYVRRSRRRFWRTDPSAPPSDALSAHATLHEVLVRVSLLLAPLCPFLTEHLFASLTQAPADGSVHLCDWPRLDVAARDLELEERMATAREVVSLGRAARSDAGIKVRQPLSRAVVFLPPGTAQPPAGVVEDELNVDRVEYSAELSDVLSYELHPNFKTLGPRLGERAKLVRAALGALDATEAARSLESGDAVTVLLDGDRVELGADDLELRVRAEEGYAVSRDADVVVALDVELDDGLVRRGIVRELVRQVQDLRKERGLQVSDHIELVVDGVDLDASERATVAREVLADSVRSGPGEGEPSHVELADGVGASVWLEARRT